MITAAWTDSGFSDIIARLTTRRAFPPEAERQARAIIDEVRQYGDRALVACAKRLDKADIAAAGIRVPDAELAAAAAALSKAERDAIARMASRVAAFARASKPRSWTSRPRKGVTLGERFHPLARVGCYVPGGTAPLVSTAVHTVAVARAAGVREVAAATPPRPDGSIDPALLHALRVAGATEVYRLGGAYAIAAFAYGTETVPRVQKIAGPGNAYVTAAKKAVFGDVGVDMLAGPSEIMIIADETCDPAHAAADMLSQAEHGSGLERAVLLTTSDTVAREAAREIEAQAATLPRREAVARVLESGVHILRVESLGQAAAIASSYAPEHLELICEGAAALAARIHGAGAVFIGPHTPEPVGDFTAGPSHVLPTAGTGSSFWGLSAAAFFSRSSVISYSKAALRREAADVAAIARLEGLEAHARSAEARLRPPRQA